ncbi:hypothetical protein PSHI8_06650 [Polynucleobacter sp. SHI8]|uniref:hypothetical protein n=1 Tax=unclassified Polynucleobacter TaxID=2640945 RepID=UPI00248F9DA5|nr:MULTISPECIES: hypothetical protein [unclassified Polynucleobacter]BDW10583.1 hypothetical protein PSHI2_06650 [Polynucleobacter sp. SHI2]BDW13029.1 hypothetical protein PSHI8_06650 [Polynucleobacter sp. SHI8]
MSRKSAFVTSSVMLLASLLTFLLWHLNKNQQKALEQPEQVISAKQSTTSADSSPQLQIPSSIDRTVDLITGNTLAQNKPANLKQEEWQKINELIQGSWSNYSTKMGKPMLSWSSNEVHSDAKKVFYPFSGPDFTTLYQIYPQADHYVMSAQQRGERLVDLSQLSPSAASQTMEVLSSAWKSFGSDGFFVTEYLFKYISTNKVKIGATTLIASFAHLHQFSIQKIVPISIDSDGSVKELTEDQSWDSVRFYLVKDNRPVILDYVRMDLSNDGMKDSPAHLAFFRESAKSPVLLKAASHLPQHKGFTMIRDEMLNNAPMVVQDETGLDYQPLNQQFNTVLYGSFVKAYKVFSTYNTELAKAYKLRDDEKKLPFRIGYFKDGNYALIVATRKL